MTKHHEAPTDRDPDGHVTMPPDTGPNPPAMPGTSEAAPPVQGIYRPDMGPDGRDVNTTDHALPGRGRTSRGPDQGDNS